MRTTSIRRAQRKAYHNIESSTEKLTFYSVIAGINWSRFQPLWLRVDGSVRVNHHTARTIMFSSDV